MRMLCQRVERFSPQLLTFVAGSRMNASHNAAERSLRPTAVSRKISGGTRSEQASETKSIMASLFGSLRLQGRNPYLALNSLLSNPYVPQSEQYRFLAPLLGDRGLGSLAAVPETLLFLRRPDVPEHDIERKIVPNLQEGRAYQGSPRSGDVPK